MSADRRVRPWHLGTLCVGVPLAGYGALRLAGLFLPLLVGGSLLAAAAWDLTRKRP